MTRKAEVACARSAASTRSTSSDPASREDNQRIQPPNPMPWCESPAAIWSSRCCMRACKSAISAATLPAKASVALSTSPKAASKAALPWHPEQAARAAPRARDRSAADLRSSGCTRPGPGAGALPLLRGGGNAATSEPCAGNDAQALPSAAPAAPAVGATWASAAAPGTGQPCTATCKASTSSSGARTQGATPRPCQRATPKRLCRGKLFRRGGKACVGQGRRASAQAWATTSTLPSHSSPSHSGPKGPSHERTRNATASAAQQPAARAHAPARRACHPDRQSLAPAAAQPRPQPATPSVANPRTSTVESRAGRGSAATPP
mmetsp:Transcript_51732/g.160492  ORF Transcript_51732/g.160492 Transcript_51732/m.160492 type:complete len:321 (-) Transcript_51732:1270-2232(-)